MSCLTEPKKQFANNLPTKCLLATIRSLNHFQTDHMPTRSIQKKIRINKIASPAILLKPVTGKAQLEPTQTPVPTTLARGTAPHDNELIAYFRREAQNEIKRMFVDERECELLFDEYDSLRKKDGQDKVRALANDQSWALVLMTPKIGTAVLLTGTAPPNPAQLETNSTTFFAKPVLSKAAFGMRTVKISMGPDEAVWMSPLEPKRCRIANLYRETESATSERIDKPAFDNNHSTLKSLSELLIALSAIPEKVSGGVIKGLEVEMKQLSSAVESGEKTLTTLRQLNENSSEIATSLRQLIRETQTEREALSAERNEVQQLVSKMQVLRQQWHDQAFGGNHG